MFEYTTVPKCGGTSEAEVSGCQKKYINQRSRWSCPDYVTMLNHKLNQGRSILLRSYVRAFSCRAVPWELLTPQDPEDQDRVPCADVKCNRCVCEVVCVCLCTMHTQVGKCLG